MYMFLLVYTHVHTTQDCVYAAVFIILVQRHCIRKYKTGFYTVDTGCIDLFTRIMMNKHQFLRPSALYRFHKRPEEMAFFSK